MLNVKLVTTKVVISMVAVGSLTFGGAGVAGATAAPSSPAAQSSTHVGRHGAADRLCHLYRQRQEFKVRQQAKFAAKTAGFAALADKARKAGHTKLADYWDSVVARRTAHSAKSKANLAAHSSKHVHALGRVGNVC